MPWDPSLYERFDQQRHRPALDLLAQVVTPPARVVDLGCGTGALTAVIAERWPDAELYGLDNSPEMLERARRDHPLLQFEHGDIEHWRPGHPLDLIYSNAALHWLDRHAELFPRLVGHLTAGGILAVQMPRNHHHAAYRLASELALAGPWIHRLEPVLRQAPVSDPEFYYRVLIPHVETIDIWETEYLHRLEGDNPVATWLEGTYLQPILAALGDEAEDFRDEWARRVAEAHPPLPDGTTLFPFRRLFIVARR